MESILIEIRLVPGNLPMSYRQTSDNYLRLSVIVFRDGGSFVPATWEIAHYLPRAKRVSAGTLPG
jgi:hypothetical protein